MPAAEWPSCVHVAANTSVLRVQGKNAAVRSQLEATGTISGADVSCMFWPAITPSVFSCLLPAC